MIDLDPRRFSGMVVDASVVINLLALADVEPLLECLPDCILDPSAAGEVRRHPRTGDSLDSGDLVDLGFTIAARSPSETALFVELCFGPPPDDLDDGEAGSLAIANSRNLALAVDERKARRLLRQRYPRVTSFSTTDILYWASRDTALKNMDIGLALFDSLRFSRMRVPPRHRDWVVEQLGAERVAQCRSLPIRWRKAAQATASRQ